MRNVMYWNLVQLTALSAAGAFLTLMTLLATIVVSVQHPPSDGISRWNRVSTPEESRQWEVDNLSDTMKAMREAEELRRAREERPS